MDERKNTSMGGCGENATSSVAFSAALSAWRGWGGGGSGWGLGGGRGKKQQNSRVGGRGGSRGGGWGSSTGWGCGVGAPGGGTVWCTSSARFDSSSASCAYGKWECAIWGERGCDIWGKKVRETFFSLAHFVLGGFMGKRGCDIWGEWGSDIWGKRVRVGLFFSLLELLLCRLRLEHCHGLSHLALDVVPIQN